MLDACRGETEANEISSHGKCIVHVAGESSPRPNDADDEEMMIILLLLVATLSEQNIYYISIITEGLWPENAMRFYDTKKL
jgi:hypothetical protein